MESDGTQPDDANAASRLDAARQLQAEGDSSWMRSPLALVAGGLLFLGALALIVLGVTSGSDDDVENDVALAATSAPISFGGVDVPEVDDVVVAGERLPLMTADGDPAIGMRAPEVTATSLATGTRITLGPGRARVIGFFAHWCPHCQAELPEVTQWLADNRLPPNTEFIAISTIVDEGRGNYPPSKWFTDVGFSSPVLVDDGDASLLSAFGFTGFPAFVAVDSSGAVIGRATGNIGTEGLADLFDDFAR